MSQIFDFISSNTSALLPGIVTIVLAAFVVYGKKVFESMTRVPDFLYEEPNQPSFDDHLKHLITRDDVNLRVLEEVFATGRSRHFYLPTQNSDSRRASTLRQIQNALRIVLRDAIKSDDFEVLRDRVLRLIDDAQKEIDALQQRKPFDGLLEPEKSLLVDLIADIPQEKTIPRQKALQLADIIKLKHQDMLKLQTENAKSAAWTRWGTYGTIFFGILSIVLSIYTTMK